MNPLTIHAIEIAAIVVAGTMTGNEIAIAVFVHPGISRLEDAFHARAAQALAKILGAAMPFWYMITFLLNLAVVFIAHKVWATPRYLALSSTILLGVIILYTILLPAPLNSKIARWQPDSLPANWREMRRRWDMLHAIRVIFLIVSLVLLVGSAVV